MLKADSAVEDAVRKLIELSVRALADVRPALQRFEDALTAAGRDIGAMVRREVERNRAPEDRVGGRGRTRWIQEEKRRAEPSAG